MEENTYNKLNRPKFFKQAEINESDAYIKTLKDIIFDIENGNFVDFHEVLTSYCHELKEILKINNSKLCLEKFFKLEDTLLKLEELNENLPTLLDFHKSFSSTVLRIFWECIASEDMQSLSSRFLEAFRIAIEEELYIWQEKIH
jgi:hypothetical protein